MSNAATPEPSPALFFDTITGFERTAALKAAIDLGLFTVIGKGYLTAEAIAASCETSQRGIRILSDGAVKRRGANTVDVWASLLGFAAILTAPPRGVKYPAVVGFRLRPFAHFSAIK